MKAGKLVLSAIVTLNLAAMVWRLDVRRHLHASMSAVEVLRAGLALTLVSATLLALIWTRWGKIASACLLAFFGSALAIGFGSTFSPQELTMSLRSRLDPGRFGLRRAQALLSCSRLPASGSARGRFSPRHNE